RRPSAQSPGRNDRRRGCHRHPAHGINCSTTIGKMESARCRHAVAGSRPGAFSQIEGGRMLWTIFVVLMILWLLGMVSSYTLGGFIHILLLLAIAVVLIRVIQGRNP